MISKNDPLIGAVQQVMQRNQAEREAVKTVNEKFGVVDRRALPHEQQANWDAAYAKVLSEGVEALDEIADTPKGKEAVRIAVHRADATVVDSAINPPRSKKGKRKVKNAMKTIDRGIAVHKKQGDVLDPYLKRSYGLKKEELSPKQKMLAKLAGNKNKIDAPDLAAARAGKASHIEEENLEEKITKSMSAGDVISDFVHSENPKFADKSKKERMRMALGAYYAKHPEKSKTMKESKNNLSEVTGTVTPTKTTIGKGDTLAKIAQQTGRSIEDIMKLNPQIKDPNKIRAGDTLNLGNTPSSQKVIKTGETLTQIAKERQMTVPELLKQNPQIKDPNKIIAGKGINAPTIKSVRQKTGDIAPTPQTSTAQNVTVKPTTGPELGSGTAAANAMERDKQTGDVVKRIERQKSGSAQAYIGSLRRSDLTVAQQRDLGIDATTPDSSAYQKIRNFYRP